MAARTELVARVIDPFRADYAIDRDGGEEDLTILPCGALRRARAHLPKAILSMRAFRFTASGGVAGVTHGTAFGTTAPLGLANPTNSGVAAIVDFATIGYVSGTLGIGYYAWGQMTQAAITTGFLTTRQWGIIGGAQSPGRAACLAYSNTAQTGTATMLRASGITYNGTLATTVYQPSPVSQIQVEGGFIVLPGSRIVLQGIGTAGTTPLLVHSIAWYEVPLSLVVSPRMVG